MLSIKQQRLHKVPNELLRRTKLHEFEIPNNIHEVISATIKNTDKIEELLKKDMISQILNDEYNQMTFYEIYNPDLPAVTAVTTTLSKSPRVINFHSVNSMQELSTLKKTKLFQKRKVGKYVKNLREQLKKDQDKQLLLSEMQNICRNYEKLDHHRGQNEDLQSLISIRRSSQDGKSSITIDQQSVNELENWSKFHQPVSVPHKNLQSQNSLINKQVNMLGESLREIPPVKSMRKVTLSHRTSIYQLDQVSSPLLLGSDDEIIEKPQVDPSSLKIEKKIKLKERIFGAFKRVQASFQQEQNQQQLINSGGDHLDTGTSKRIQLYLAQGSNLSMDEYQEIGLMNQKESERNQGDRNQGVVLDFSADGLQTILNKLIRVNSVTFNNEAEKGAFHQKQTSLVLKKVNYKFSQHKKFVEKHQQTVDMLRIETHDINEKLTQIKQLIKVIMMEIDGINELENRSINKSYDNPDSVKKDQKKGSQLYIVVPQTNKLLQLKNDCVLLQESQDNYKQKLKFNKQTLERLDKDIAQKKKDDKKLKKASISLYLYILFGGQDIRQTGIVWILQILWEMEEKVYDAQLPMFLDQKAKEFIFIKARRLQELNDMKQQQGSYFKNYQQQAQGSFDSSLSIMLKNISLNASLQDLLYNDGSSLPSVYDSKKFGSINLKQARQEFSAKQTKQISYDDIHDLTRGMNGDDKSAVEHLVSVLSMQVLVTANDLVYLETKKKLKEIFKIPNNAAQKIKQDTDASSQSQTREITIQLYEQIAKQIDVVQEQLKKLEEEELTRIIKEFDFKQYARRYSTDPATVLSCLFGASRSDKELMKSGLKKRHQIE